MGLPRFGRILVLVSLAVSACALHREREIEQRRLPPHQGWFVKQRMTAGESIPAGALRRAATPLPAAPGIWTNVGPLNQGGRATSIAVDPNDTDHVWLGLAAGGVFESTDAGTTWAPVFDEQAVLPVGALAAHPVDSNIVYVGTGEANGAGYSYDGDGVYKTTDGGDTWQHVGLTETRRIGRIVIDPVDPQRVFVAAAGNVYAPDAHRGVFRSTDGGVTWSNVLFVAPTAGAIDLAIDPSNPARIYAAIWEHYSTPTAWVAGGLNSGIWQSLNGGDTWTRLAGGLPGSSANVGRIGLTVAASNPQIVYAVYMDDPGELMGIYKTINSGISWSKQNASGARQATGGFGYYTGQIRVDPANANVVYFLDVFGARSTDGGRSYDDFPLGYVDHHDMVILPDRMYQANDAGFHRSMDGGATWFRASLPATQFYDIGINPVDTSKRFGGTQDLGSLRTTDGSPSNWNNILGGDGFQCEVDPIVPSRVYCSQAFGNIFRSSNGGDSFLSGFHGITASDRTNWNAPLVHDPLTTQRLYTGTYRVYRTTDGAANWNAISGDLTGGHPQALSSDRKMVEPDSRSHLANVVDGTITTLAASAADGDVVWAGTDDGHVWVTTNGGSTWTNVDVPDRSEWVTRVEADPFSPSTAYATFSGFRNGSPLPRIFRTVDSGATWTDISGDLPDVPLNGVNADSDPAMRGRLFVASDLGVFVTDDYGSTWSKLGTGMPPVVVMDLDLITSTRQLFAGTHGRSIYVYDLTQLGPADADGDGVNNLADCRPDDPTVFAAPGEVAGLAFDADRVTLSWSSAASAAGPATEHQVLRGLVTGLPAGAGSETCLQAATLASSTVDSQVPSAGETFWYLVRGRNDCGIGTYGSTSGGSPRVSTACP